MNSIAHGRVAIVTGGSTGLGLAITELFLRNGYRVLATALADSPERKALAAEGLPSEFIASDLNQPEAQSHIVIKHAISLWNQIDVLVNCAGRISHKEVADVTTKDWDEILNVNVKAPFFMAQAAVAHLEKTQGCIINISSTAAKNPMLKNQIYDTSKAALNQLTRSLAMEFRERKVRVNALMPGGMRTPLVEEWLEKHLGHKPTAAELDSPNMRRPEDTAQGVLALASPELWLINGAEIAIDSGFHIG